MAQFFHGFRGLLAVLLVTAILWCAPRSAAETARPDFFAAPFVDGSPQWVTFINDLVGWRPYAEAGFLGSSTVVGNIEAGHIWTGHEVFVRNPAVTNGFITYTNAHALNELDFHATMVGHVLAGSGYDGTNYTLLGIGMVPEATVLSGSVATEFSTNNLGGFATSYESVVTPYRAFMTGEGVPRADVINSSWGGADPAAASPEALALDGLAAQNPNAALVASAGNDGAAQVGWPGSGYNTIAVGALGGNAFMSPADFTSRGLVDFFNPVTGLVTSNARVAVNIAAPGEHFYLAAYLGNQGGIPAALPDLVEEPPPTDLYFIDIPGTSFSGPTVAGGLAVLKDVANRDPFWNLNGLTNAQDTRVTKSVLMAGALETFGWDNGQTMGTNGAVVTSRALDAATGAGAMDLVRAGDAYFFGTRDVDGTGGGVISGQGWDFGAVTLGGSNDYFFDAAFGPAVELTVSLNWFAGRAFDMETNLGSNLSFADLNLEVWEVADGAFSSLVASSSSLFNNSEYLRLDLTGDRTFGLRVNFDGMVFDQTAGVTSESYGLAWLAKPYETLYWNGGATNGTWSGLNSSWDASPPGTNTPTEAITTALDQLVIAPGASNSLAITVDGPQMARRIDVQSGAVTLTGTNGAAVNLQNGGLVLGAGANGDATLTSSVSLLLSGDQAWSNASSFALKVEGGVTGQGSVSLRHTGAGSIVISGSMNSAGAITNNGTGSGTTTISGVIGDNVTGVTQDSATSMLILTGTNTYTGHTTVAEGRLVVDGDISASALTTVEAGGVLGGSGSVGDTILLAGGTVSPGHSPGTQTYGSLTWEGGANYNWQLDDAGGAAGTGYDTFVSTGAFTINATEESRFNINLWTLAGTGPDTNGSALNFESITSYTWTLGTFASISGFAADNFAINTFATNGTGGFANITAGAFRVDTNATSLLLVYTAPEIGERFEWAAGEGDWNTADRWTNNSVPPATGAQIYYSGAGGVSTNDVATGVSGLTFNADAGAYTVLGDALSIGAFGIVNNSTAQQTVNLDLSLAASQAFSATSGDLVFGGTVHLDTYTLLLDGAANLTMNGVVSGLGGIVKAGVGTVTLSGATANSFVGGTTVSAGTLVLDKTGVEAITTSVTVNGGTLLLGAADQMADTATVTLDGGTFSLGGNAETVATLQLNSGALSDGTLTVGSAIGAQQGTVSANLAGSAGLTKSTPGTLTLAGANTFDGGVVVNGGTLVLGGGAALVDTAAVTLGNTAGATLQIDNDEIIGSLSGSGATNATLALGVNTLTLNQTANTTYSGAVTGTGVVAKSGGGTLTLDRATAVGAAFDLSIEQGTVDLNRVGAALRDLLGYGNKVLLNRGTLALSAFSGANGDITFGGIAVHADSALRLERTSNTDIHSSSINAPLTFSNNATLSIAYGERVAGGTTTFNGSGGNTLYSDGTLQLGAYAVAITTAIGESGGSFSFTKTGAGTLTLSAVNTYTGATVVSAGVLELAGAVGGALGSTSEVNIAENAVLLVSQSNQVQDSANVSLSGGTITRGSGVSEVFGSLNVNGSGILDFGTGTAGRLTFGVYQDNTATASALLTLRNFIPGNSFTFINSSFTEEAIGSYFTFGPGFVDYSLSNTDTTFTITAIPEPSTYLAAAGLLALSVWPVRRRLLKELKSILRLRPRVA